MISFNVIIPLFSSTRQLKLASPSFPTFHSDSKLHVHWVYLCSCNSPHDYSCKINNCSQYPDHHFYCIKDLTFWHSFYCHICKQLISLKWCIRFRKSTSTTGVPLYSQKAKQRETHWILDCCHYLSAPEAFELLSSLTSLVTYFLNVYWRIQKHASFKDFSKSKIKILDRHKCKQKNTYQDLFF